MRLPLNAGGARNPHPGPLPEGEGGANNWLLNSFLRSPPKEVLQKLNLLVRGIDQLLGGRDEQLATVGRED